MAGFAGKRGSPFWRVCLAVLGRLPQAALSRAFGSVAGLPLPPSLRAPAYRAFARTVGARLDEVELPLRDYPSLGAFFVRRLKPGARRWPGDDAIAGSPVDGIAGAAGTIEDGRLIQAKGVHYGLAELLDDGDAAHRFRGGSFVTIYLGPGHYHRIHSPTRAAIIEARHVPGSLFPVNAAAVTSIPGLFTRNERLIAQLEGPLGRVAVIAVGAYNVGRISAAFEPGWHTNRRGAGAETRVYEPPRRVDQGDEIMAFHLGSTVILLFEPGRVQLVAAAEGSEARLGTPVAVAAGPPV